MLVATLVRDSHRIAQSPARNPMQRTVHNLAGNAAQNQACSGLAALPENGRVAGSQEAHSALVGCNTARPASALGWGRAGRQTFTPVQREGSGTRPVSGCLELLACGALGVVPRSSLAMVGAAKAAQQQREALRFIAEHGGALQNRRARAGDGERQAASRQARRRREAGRQGEAVLAGLTQRQPERHSFQGDSTSVGMRCLCQATGRKAGGHVGRRRRARNVSPIRSAGRWGAHEGGQGHIGGAWARAWGKRFAYAISRVPTEGVNALTPLGPCEPETSTGGASCELGQGRGRGMSPAARQSAGSTSRRGMCGGNISSTPRE